MRTTTAVVAIILTVLVVPSRAQNPPWHLTATVAESCSCTVSCPCNFGGEPSRMPCEGNRMISIEGNSEDVDLAGVQRLVTFNMRTWSKIYVSDKVDTQFRSVSHTHSSAAQTWSHKGANGFTSKWDVGSK